MSHTCRIMVLTVVLGAALLTTGCNDADIPPSMGESASGGPPPLPDSSPPPTPTLLPITPAPGQRERVARWSLADSSEDGRRLLVDVAVGGPPCDTVTGVDVSETDTTVTVTVYAGRLTSADCPAGAAGSLATARVEAMLTRPLADRELLGSAP